MLSFFIFNYSVFLVLVMFVISNLLNMSLNLSNYISNYNNYLSILLSFVVFLFVYLMFYIYSVYLSEYTNSYFYPQISSHFFNIYYFPFLYIFVLITAVSLVFCLSYNLSELFSFLIYVLVISVSGLGLFYSDSVILFFVFYEFLLLPSFLILYNYSNTSSSVEAAYLMFFWTQFGAMFLIFVFFYIFFVTGSLNFSSWFFFNFTSFEINFIFLFFLIGFGVNLPIWPFYDWLPKAHVEASTNFSIFLSGVLVNFAFFGFLNCLIFLESEPTFIYVFPYLFIGLVDSVFKIFYQIDINNVIAFCTVAEMHWLLICIISGQSFLWLAGFAMLISHAIISTNSFLMVDSIASSFNTSLVTEISGLNFLCPKLFLLSLINCIVFLGFPGTLFFISEFLLFTFIIDLFPIYSFFLIFLVYILLASFFLSLWMNILFSSVSYYSSNLVADLDNTEFTIFSFFIVLIFWLGNTWQSYIF